jgi:uncharacterized protein YjeT (DUF2065 family)
MRVVNRIAGAILALLLIALGLLAIVETVLWALDRPPWLFPLESWRDSVASTALGDRAVLAWGIGLLVAGLGVLILQMRRLAPARLRSAERSGGVVGGDARTGDWWLNRRTVERRAATAVNSLWGVHDVKARAQGRPGQWRLTVSADAASEIHESEVEQAVRDELARLSVPPDVPVTVELHHARRVA